MLPKGPSSDCADEARGHLDVTQNFCEEADAIVECCGENFLELREKLVEFRKKFLQSMEAHLSSYQLEAAFQRDACLSHLADVQQQCGFLDDAEDTLGLILHDLYKLIYGLIQIIQEQIALKRYQEAQALLATCYEWLPPYDEQAVILGFVPGGLASIRNELDALGKQIPADITPYDIN